MPVPAYLVDAHGVLLHTETVGAHTHLIIEQHSRVSTQYKSASHTTNTTTAVSAPPPGQAMVVTDITVSGEKINGGTIVVQFAEGSDTAIVYKGHVTDGPVNLHIAYEGRNLGWRDARIDFVTDTSNQDATVTVGYYFVSGSISRIFADWDGLRN